MSENWFYRVFGEEFGPVSLNDLREFAANGTLSGDDEVRPEALSMWVPAKAVRELQEHYQDMVESASTMTTAMNDAAAAPVATDEWYYRMTDDEDVEVGPLTFDALIELAKSGRLTSDDEVRLGVDSKWRRAGSMGRLVAVLPYQTRRRRNATPLPETQVDSLKAMMAALPDVVSEDASSEDSEEALPEVVSEEPVLERKTSRPKAASRAEPADNESSDRATLRPKARRVDKKPTKPIEAVSADLAQEIEDQILETLMAPSPPKAAEDPASMPSPRPMNPSSAVAASQESWNSSPASVSTPSPSFSRPTSMPTTRKPTKPTRSGPSLAERFKNPNVIKGLSLVVVLGLILSWVNSSPGSGADISRYRELDALFGELKELREKDKEGKKFIPFKDKFLQTAKRIQQEVEPTAGSDFPARQRLLWTTKNCMPDMSSSLVTETPAEKQALANLEQAAFALGLKEAPKVQMAASNAASD